MLDLVSDSLEKLTNIFEYKHNLLQELILVFILITCIVLVKDSPNIEST